MTTRLARLILAAFPPAFRAQFGDDFRATLGDVAAESRHRGPLGAIRLARWLLADLVRAAPREWGTTARRRWSSRPRRPSPLPIPRPSHTLPPGQRMDSLLQDLRYALRTLRRAPAFSLVVVASLALGIGVNTLTYSVLDGLVLRPFNFPDPNTLVTVGVTRPVVSSDRSFIETLSPPEFVDIRAGVPSLERVSAFDLGNRTLSGGDRAERVYTAFVWGDPLASLGLQPHLGRSFRDDETTREGSPVALLSHRVWQSRFGGDSAVVGGTVRVNGVTTTVVGILPPDALLVGTDVWLPMAVDPLRIPRRAQQYAILARLRPGATLDDVNRELAQVAQRTESTHRAELASYEGWRLEAAPWAEALTSQAGLRQAAFILQGAVFLVLLIACANVAGLLLSRGATRQQEIAMRRALGARSGRVVRQLLTEGTILSVLGAVVGLGIAVWCMNPISAALPAELQGMEIAARLNGRVLLFTLATALLAGVAFSLAPALQLAGPRAARLFGQAPGRATLGRAARRFREGFLAVQVALAVVLLSGAGLLVRSFGELQRVDVGFNPAQVLTMRLSLPREKYAWERIVPTIEDLVSRIESVPGVRAAAASTQFPPGNGFSAPLALPGEQESLSASRTVDVTNASPGYFTAMGYQLQQGRLPAVTDNEQAPRVAVINETAARRYFAGRSALGERIILGDTADQATVEVVGVVRDVRNRGLDAPTAPEVFIPARQQQVRANNQFWLLVRTAGAPLAALGGVRDAIHAFDPDQPVYAIGTVEQAFGDALLQRRAALWFLFTFAAIALLLACVGIHALVNYSVSERTREIGIRMALGAVAGDVRRLVLRQTLVVVGIGVTLGLAMSLAAGGALRALVFGVSPTDPVTLAIVAALLPIVGLLAAAAPAWRATHVDPVQALREG